CGWGPLTNIVFVTSEVYTGNLGGIAGGDAKCQALADAAGLPGTYLAWLGASNPEVSPVTRFTKSPYPYVLVDGTKIADDWDDLVDGDIDNPISLDQWGLPPPLSVGITCNGQQLAVYTGTSSTGDVVGSNCTSWTSSSGQVACGRRNFTMGWGSGCTGPWCDNMAPLYCFEQ